MGCSGDVTGSGDLSERMVLCVTRDLFQTGCMVVRESGVSANTDESLLRIHESYN